MVDRAAKTDVRSGVGGYDSADDPSMLPKSEGCCVACTKWVEVVGAANGAGE